MQRTHRGVALDTVFDENGTRHGISFKTIGHVTLKMFFYFAAGLHERND